MTKIDPYNNKEKYLAWKEQNQSQISGISKENSDLTLRFLNDMEFGLNIGLGSKRGSRGYFRLTALKQRMIALSKTFEKRCGLNKLTDITEAQIFSYFGDMRNGILKRQDGKTYISPTNFVKDFKTFWHWWMKVNKKEGIELKDITADLDTSGDKPDWVYLTEEQIKKLCNEAKYEYKVLIWFLFDTGIRAPTEMMNVKVSDFFNDFKELNIREETSKTFRRRIKLMICSDLIRDYVKTKNLKGDDCLFTISPPATNKYLKRLAKRVLGNGKSPAGSNYTQLTMYDFRHCSCCYWLPRYKSESALKYRFGWKKSDKIHYYSEMLGMKDTISEEDMLIDITKIELEKRLDKFEKENQMLKEDNQSIRQDNEAMKIQIAQIGELTKILYTQMKINREIQI
ncbi:site-specific integrase [Candidatus Woesearchaeota archaeon]|nr:site-specific integrase [Candidatus Woesearchaeota archaeon]